MKDKLETIFTHREEFLQLLIKRFPESFPNQWPVDITTKDSQKFIRQIALNGVEEMFEALGHLKNWKPHRTSDLPDIDQEEFLEEIVDAFNYFFNLLILCGVDSKKFFSAFERKHEIIKKRLTDGY